MTAATAGPLAQARRDRDRAQAAVDRLLLALYQAERGGPTVVRIEHVRDIVRAR